jgi:hypothetical protein
MALTELRFRIDGVDAGEAASTFIPDVGWTVQLENMILGVEPGLYEVISRPHAVFASRGTRFPGRMRSIAVYVDVTLVKTPDNHPGVSAQQGMR